MPVRLDDAEDIWDSADFRDLMPPYSKFYKNRWDGTWIGILHKSKSVVRSWAKYGGQHSAARAVLVESWARYALLMGLVDDEIPKFEPMAVPAPS